MRFIGLFFIFIFSWNFLLAQPTNKAQRLLQKGEYQITLKNPQKAEKFFFKSIHADPQNPSGYYSLASLLESQNKFDQAVKVYELGLKRCYQCKDAFTLMLANSLYRNKQYQEAGQVIANWNKPKLSKQKELEFNLLQQNIQFAISKSEIPTTQTAENLGSRINSEFDEYFPFVRQNDSVLLFTRKTAGIDEDIYGAHLDSCGGWFIARSLDLPYSTSEHEGSLMISADEHYMFLMRCGNRTYNHQTGGGCDIYFSYTKGPEWTTPTLMGATINTPYYEGMPCLSSDNTALYFSSNRPGGYGGNDIWVSYFKDGFWQIPENLGPDVNTPGDEFNPWIAPDHQTLYFNSNGHPGYGGQDIYVSKKKNGSWSEVTNLGPSINSPFDDISFSLSPTGQKGYFSSNRPEGFGGFDIYEVLLENENKPEETSYVYGIIKDSLSGKSINYAFLEWHDANSGEKAYEYKSNKGDGSFLSAIKTQHPFLLRVYRPGYLEFKDTITLEICKTFPPDTMNISLLPEGYQPELKDSLLFRYYYVKNDINIEDSIRKKIQDVIEPFRNRDFTTFQINGYTDDSGTPVINEELSFKRAKLIADILLEYEVSETQMQIQGWADSNPIRSNDSEENRAKNRRVEIMISMPK